MAGNEVREKWSEIYNKFFLHLQEKKDYFLPCIDHRMSCEKWLQLEFVKLLSDLKKHHDIGDYEPEREYPKPGTGFCDIWYSIDGMEIWLEIQVIVTNYGKPGINITNRVDHILRDIKKLQVAIVTDKRHILTIVYPLRNDGRNGEHWAVHTSKIRNVLSSFEKISELVIDDTYMVWIYFSEC